MSETRRVDHRRSLSRERDRPVSQPGEALERRRDGPGYGARHAITRRDHSIGSAMGWPLQTLPHKRGSSVWRRHGLPRASLSRALFQPRALRTFGRTALRTGPCLRQDQEFSCSPLDERTVRQSPTRCSRPLTKGCARLDSGPTFGRRSRSRREKTVSEASQLRETVCNCFNNIRGVERH